MSDLVVRVARRFLRGAAPKKRMIIMMGPPAAGKGFFLGEPELDAEGNRRKYKVDDTTERETRYGWKLPQMLVNDNDEPLLTDADIPDRPEQDESDNHLRAIQFEESRRHFDTLKAAHEEGEEAFEKALDDHWYMTKDGDTVKLGRLVSFKDFPEDHAAFHKKTNKEFYVSMRGWHDDAKKRNEETGKPTERFKDEARHRFDESVSRKTMKAEDLLIVDSAGEDIDAQDYKGQIEAAKARGFEVTVIFLHPEQADTELSNLSRGKVMGKRMVDQSDITNWYKNNEAALKEIQGAEPDNFLHYRKGPPDDNPRKAADLRAKARELMHGLAKMNDEEKASAKEEISNILYGQTSYKLNTETSYGHSLNGLPKRPKAADIARAVTKMNTEAEKRSGQMDDPTREEEKPGKSKTRMDFLREMGDHKVSNPNQESRKRFPKVKIRSLPWEHQKPFYEKWQARQASVLRVASRYMESTMVNDKGWLAGWMKRVADQADKLAVADYEVKAEAGNGPLVYVTVKKASEDGTAARKARQQLEKIMEASLKKEVSGYDGFDYRVRSYNRGRDLVLECEVLFP